jgi:hypothetical protein
MTEKPISTPSENENWHGVRSVIQSKLESAMRRRLSVWGAFILLSGLITACGCLAANSYEKPTCEKYRTNWNIDRIYNEE